MSTRDKILADLYLGYRAVVVHPLRRLFQRGPRGEAKFLANYAVEGLVPTLPKDRAWLAAAGRCISCGLCDQVDGLLGHLSRTRYDGVSLLPRQYARSTTELAALAPTIRRLDPEAYREAEARCPTGVPLVGLTRWLQRRLERLEEEGRRWPAPPADFPSEKIETSSRRSQRHARARETAERTIRPGGEGPEGRDV